MVFLLKHAVLASALGWLGLAVGLSNYPGTTITRDVAIIGGGSSGTYAAIRLRDEGKSVVVVEREDELGGHTNTYRDPITNQTVDFGVIVFHNQQITKDYFDRLNVPWEVAPTGTTGTASQTTYVDVQTGDILNHTALDPAPGLQAYVAELSKYPDLELGFFLPDPVSEDLLLPFGEFVEKYSNISSAVPTIFQFAQGLGDFLNQPTLYVLKNFGSDIIQDINTGFLTTSNQDNHEIYDNAQKILGQDVFLQSEVIATDRSSNGSVQVVISTPSGVKVIKAKKLLVAVPQKLTNLANFDLDGEEKYLFSHFLNTGYYTSLVRNTGFPDTLNVQTISPDSEFNLPRLPGLYAISPTAVPGLFDIKYGSPTGLTDEFVQKDIINFIKTLRQKGLGNDTGEPEFVTFASHTPFELTVLPGVIQSGFYKELYALQGHRNTYYTGAAFHTQDSSLLWNFTESYVLPQLLK